MEDVLGRWRFLGFYLFCGVLAGIGGTVFSGNSTVIGASGAVAAVMGGYTIVFRHARLTFMLLFWQWKLSVVGYFGIWIAFNLLGLLVGFHEIAWGVHVVGFGSGLLISGLAYKRIIKNHPLLKGIIRAYKVV